ncbi:MAG TPA: lactonase family protein [Eubacteriales bacterium]|nr:lactonase family protein [Eubacteriales bacterium]
MQRNRLVFIGSYSQPIRLGTGEIVPGGGDGVTVYRMDEAGGLTRLFSAGKPNPTYLALSADNRFLYTVNELKEYHDESSAAVSAYRIDPETGGLTLISRRMTGGADTCYLAVSPNGRYLSVANYSGGSFALFPILPDGSLATPSCFVQHYGHGALPDRQAGPHVHQITADPSGNRFLVADLGTDKIFVYGIDWETGCISPNAAPAIPLAPGEGPRQFVFDHSGQFLYLVTEMGNTVCTFAYNSETGTARLLQRISTLPDGFTGGSIAACIKLHPNGKLLYTSNRGHDSIACYRILNDGTLERLFVQPLGGRTPRDFNLTPEGNFLLAGLQDSNELVRFAVDGETGTLAELERIPCGSPTAVLFADYPEER